MFCDLSSFTTVTLVYCFALVVLDNWGFTGCSIPIKSTRTGLSRFVCLKPILPTAAVRGASTACRFPSSVSGHICVNNSKECGNQVMSFFHGFLWAHAFHLKPFHPGNIISNLLTCQECSLQIKVICRSSMKCTVENMFNSNQMLLGGFKTVLC